MMRLALFCLLFSIVAATNLKVIQFHIPFSKGQKSRGWKFTELSTTTANFTGHGVSAPACRGIYKHIAWESADTFWTFCCTAGSPALLKMSWKTGKVLKNVTDPRFGSPGGNEPPALVKFGKDLVAVGATIFPTEEIGDTRQFILKINAATGKVTNFGEITHYWNSYPGYGILDTDNNILYVAPELESPTSRDYNVLGFSLKGKTAKVVANWSFTDEFWVPAVLTYNPVHKALYAVGAERNAGGVGTLGVYRYMAKDGNVAGESNFKKIVSLGKCVGPCVDISQAMLSHPKTGEMYFTYAHDGLNAPKWRVGTVHETKGKYSVTAAEFHHLFIGNVYYQPPFTVWSV